MRLLRSLRGDGTRKAVLLALAAVAMWSTAASAFKLSLRYQSPYMLLQLSSLISLAVLGAMGRLGGRWNLPLSPVRLGEAAVRGALNPFLYYLVLLEAYDRLPAQVAMVINYLWPVTLVLLSIPLLGQRILGRQIAAVLVSFGGVVVLAAGRGSGSLSADLGPVLLALASTVIWSMYWILNMRQEGDDTRKLMLNFLFGSIYLLAYGLVTGKIELPPMEGLLGSAYVGLFEMSLTYVVWLKALSLARDTAQVGNLIYLTPFLSLGVIALAVGERISPTTLVGLALVIGGVALQKAVGSSRGAEPGDSGDWPGPRGGVR
ncbi:EamA family transporter [Candidatus Fermentibacteria bacterium]|nr:EamA family transporter [Candidatus Fermentibacteria bacterium]